MLVTISPAKRLDWSDTDVAQTDPAFAADALRLAKTARNLTLRDLKALMGLSDDLARLNRDRFKAFAERPNDTRPAALAFAGDTYQGLRAGDFDAAQMEYAQDRLAILSGLYGVLRPRDAIQPYRLEMGSRLKTRRGATLYAYWGDTIAKALDARAEATGATHLVNCASQEYFGAVDRRVLRTPVIETAFYDDKDGTPKMISFFAKRARGAMARHVIETRAQHLDDLRGFATDGYAFWPEESTETRLAFRRPEATAKAA
ncbi:MAG: peroxide stress protein YaaA [Shimia sp.]